MAHQTRVSKVAQANDVVGLDLRYSMPSPRLVVLFDKCSHDASDVHVFWCISAWLVLVKLA